MLDTFASIHDNQKEIKLHQNKENWIFDQFIYFSDIFGSTDATKKNSTNKNDAQYDFGIDPWASSNVSKETFPTTSNSGWPPSSGIDPKKDTNGIQTNLFASSILPASKSTNPFL